MAPYVLRKNADRKYWWRLVAASGFELLTATTLLSSRQERMVPAGIAQAESAPATIRGRRVTLPSATRRSVHPRVRGNS